MTQPPSLLPVFPLTGVLLLPGMWQPLHIFEPRYRNMAEDAWAGDKHIGMVQPVVPRQDNSPTPDAPPENPEIFPIGCAGLMDQFERSEDGRIYLQLRGICRFRILRELPLHRGYRRVEADYAPYAGDTAPPATRDSAPLVEAVLRFGKDHKMAFDAARLQALPSAALINGLSMSLPFAPVEKQALLEAEGFAEREALLLALMEMRDSGHGDPGGGLAPPVN
jgi:Lon protease-like protein